MVWSYGTQTCTNRKQEPDCRTIRTDWGAPLVELTTTNETKKYVLVMVDPHAPSPSNPTYTPGGTGWSQTLRQQPPYGSQKQFPEGQGNHGFTVRTKNH
nr:uncharacterized protein LOC131127699 isoform X2 [Doryrhamphus excisus]